MDLKHLASYLLLGVLILNIPLIILLGVSINIIFEKNFYKGEFEKTGVYENFGGSALPDSLSGQIISYFGDEAAGPPQIEPFSKNENDHLFDVKQVIQRLTHFTYASMILVLISIIMSLLFFRSCFLKKLDAMLLASGILTLVLCSLLVLLALNFEWAFTNFHALFFPQGNWMFPSESALIMLFPQELFHDFFVAILARSLGIGILLALLAVALSIMRKDYKIHLKHY